MSLVEPPQDEGDGDGDGEDGAPPSEGREVQLQEVEVCVGEPISLLDVSVENHVDSCVVYSRVCELSCGE